MRIYIDWKIKCQDEKEEIHGAEIVGNIKLRKNYYYNLKLKTGVLRSLSRKIMLSMINDKFIEFYV